MGVPQLKPDPLDFWNALLFPPVLALAYVFVSWSYMRGIVRRGRPLTPIMRGMLKYGFVCVLGIGYLLSIGNVTGLPEQTWVVFIVGWCAIVGVFAWWRHKRKETTGAPQDRSSP